MKQEACFAHGWPHKLVILRVCDFIGFAKRSVLKTKDLGASKSMKNQ